MVLQGIGGSAGVAEGPARLISDPSDAEDLEPVVIDVGGMASHGAVVSRDLGIPCVIGTGDGTRRLRTGDRVPVDGSAGTVRMV